MRELKNHTSVTPNQWFRPIMLGMKKIFSNSSGFIKKKDGSISQLPCYVFALSRIFALITGHSVLH